VFTGLIETVGTIAEIGSRGNYRIMTLRSSIDSAGIVIGESIACDGACLTVVATQPGVFRVEASRETLARTVLGHYRVGRAVNIERALTVGSRLGGHFVSGHVDDTGTVEYLKPVGESFELGVRFNKAYDRLVVEKGSIAINGVSLTVNSCRSGRSAVNLIPYTLEHTSLSGLRTGHGVNIEFDMIGKYVVKLMAGDKQPGLTIDKLIESGW